MKYSEGRYQNWNNFTAGALSGATLALLMNPLDMLKTLYVATDLKLQIQVKNISFNPFSGLSANIISNSLFRGLQFSFYELFKKKIFTKQEKITETSFNESVNYKNFNMYNSHLSIGQKYLAAVSASFISSAITYPLDTAKKLIYTNIYIDNPSM